MVPSAEAAGSAHPAVYEMRNRLFSLPEQASKRSAGVHSAEVSGLPSEIPLLEFRRTTIVLRFVGILV